MTDEKHNNNQSLVGRLIAALLRSHWPEVLSDALKALRKALPGRAPRGMYMVLDHESTLELRIGKGKKPRSRNERRCGTCGTK